MKLKEVIRIDEKFQHSINLKLDQMRKEPIENYIPTQASMKILCEYLEELTGKKKEASTMLIGPYGKGKSHLLLVLMYLLNPFDEKLSTHLVEHFRQAEEKTGKNIQEYMERGKKYLPVVVSFGSESLEQSYRRGLLGALKRFGLEDCIPDSYYTEAVHTIQTWKREYPETYEKFLEKIGKSKARSFVKELQEEKELTMRRFQEIYPSLTAGSQFMPMIQTDIATLYEEILARICRKPYHYAGMVVIFDEFSKFMESETKESVSKDMNLVQQMCELANQSSDAARMIQIFVAHKSIKEYSGYLSQEVINTFTGVEGRLSERYFVTTQKDNYELIKNMIRKESFEKIPLDWKEIASANYGAAGFDRDFTKEEFEEIIVKGCYPMHPLTTFLLLKVSERVGQNERSLVTFLAGNEKGTLSDYVNSERDAKQCMTPGRVFDYFSPLLKRDLWNRRSHLEWSKAMMVLEKDLTEEEAEIVKTICLMRIVGLSEKMEATAQTLALATGRKLNEVKESLQTLEKKEAVLFRDKLNSYVLRQKIDVDLEEKLAQCEQEITNFSLTKELDHVMGHRYELPKRYNHVHGMTRFFDTVFMETERFLELKSTDGLYEEAQGGAFADGKILLLIDPYVKYKKSVKQHLNALKDDKLVVIYPEKPFEAEGLLRRIRGIRMILQQEDYLNHDDVLVEELLMMEEDCLYKLNWMFETHFVPGRANCNVFTNNKNKSLTFNQLLSEICEQCYGKVPRINHELINRRFVSAQIKKARKEVVRCILERGDLYEMAEGNSAEATICRATLFHTGIMTGDCKPGVNHMLSVIYNTMFEAAGKRVPMTSLYEKLRGTEIGLREGVVPIYLAHCIIGWGISAVFYEGKKEIPFQAETVELVNEHPEKYDLYIERGSFKKEDYLKKLEKVFPLPKEYQNPGQPSTRLEKIVNGLQYWFTHLPASSRMATYPEEINEKLCKLLAHNDENPRELIFEKLPFLIPQKKTNINYVLFCKKLVQAKLEIDSFYENLMGELRQVTMTCLEVTDETIKPALKEWARKKRTQTKTSVLSASAASLLEYMLSLSEESEEEVIAGLAKQITGRYPEDFRQDTVQEYKKALQNICKELENAAEQTAPEEACHLIYTDPQGIQMDKYLKAVETDSVMVFAKAAVEEAISEFGDSLEKEQKAKILLDLLQQELE